MFEKLISREQFHDLYEKLHLPTKYEEENLYDLFLTMVESLDEYCNQNEKNDFIKNFDNLNIYELYLYLLNELIFITSEDTPEKLKSRWEDDKFLSAILSISFDKYLTNEKIDMNDGVFISKYNPRISSLRLYLNFMSKIMEKYSLGNPSSSLIADLLSKCIKISRCCLDLLEDGFESEAFSTWRTLHETECVLVLLTKYEKDIIPCYLKHLNYSLAFRRILEPEKGDKLFAEMKEEMRELQLKSKDIKKFIEYGYLLAIPEVKNDPTFKFNFRDGVEKFAGLSDYAKLYELSSEIAHSSPLMIYSNDELIFHLTLSSLYETFFRIEKAFANLYLSNIKEDEAQRFINLRNIYYQQIVSLHAREKQLVDSLKK